MRAWLLLALAALAAAGCRVAPPGTKADATAEAVAVRAADSAFNAAIQRHDLAVVAATYAPNAALLWQHEPRISGGPAIRQAWAQSFGLPGFALRLHSRLVTPARAGDLALDEGVLELELPGPGGVVKATGKYLAVWQKLNGAWKVLYDVYNTDAPPDRPTAPAEARPAP